MSVEPDLPAIEAFWREHGDGPRPAVFWFGDSPALADELADLVVTGPKRATAGLVRDTSDDEPVPVEGQRWIVLDGSGRPVAIIRTTEVRIGPLSSVTDRFAWDEGENDRSRDGWLAAHHEYFRRQAALEGFAFDPDLATVFERFAVLWPPGAADA